MTKIATSTLDLIGRTPLLEPQRYNKQTQSLARILVKAEAFSRREGHGDLHPHCGGLCSPGSISMFPRYVSKGDEAWAPRQDTVRRAGGEVGDSMGSAVAAPRAGRGKGTGECSWTR